MEKKLKNFSTDLPCISCGHCAENENCLHHLLTRRVYEEFQYKDWNLISVCQKCHNEFHSKGTAFMAEKYPSVKEWLISHDWFFCEYAKKYRRDGF